MCNRSSCVHLRCRDGFVMRPVTHYAGAPFVWHYRWRIHAYVTHHLIDDNVLKRVRDIVLPCLDGLAVGVEQLLAALLLQSHYSLLFHASIAMYLLSYQGVSNQRYREHPTNPSHSCHMLHKSHPFRKIFLVLMCILR